MSRDFRRIASDAEHAADIRREIEEARTPADQLTLMRGYLIEFDRSSSRYPELDCDRTKRLRAELVEEIERLEKLNSN